MTVEEFLALPAPERAAFEATLLTPEQEARCEAMTARAEVHEAGIARAMQVFHSIRPNDAAANMLAIIVAVLIADEMRCSALGVPPTTWDKTLARHGVFGETAIAVMREQFSKEAMH